MNTVNDLNGILVVDKPKGWTSNDVVRKTRNMLGHAKVGHAGTLDPNATGLLILLVGRARKLASFFEGGTKRYLADVRFGTSTDTYDCDGEVVADGDPETVNMKALSRAVDGFLGVSMQIPPMYSARKVKGRKLYKLARAGEVVEREPKQIEIMSIFPDYSGYPLVRLDIVCSRGTYIRSIAHELGREVGCPSHLENLRRIASGTLTIDDALPFAELAERADPQELVSHLIPAASYTTNGGR